ncbi:GRIP and coiled-coil domain-containing protein 2-like [Cydia fagiglandana]|uniref:GRIP and coiled-coil domain-containing protein 2-like n=1 Tax=Cydia fagiglandana TaxID=1458189 RepID=UPI002FEE1CE2
MEEYINYLDREYEQFLEIMRPHISQLKDRELACICSAWIKRLCACKSHEKILRNKYIVTLCYQLSKGILDKPFLEEPTDKELMPISEPTLSEVPSSEVGCFLLDCEEASNMIHFNKSLKTQTVEPFHNSVVLDKKVATMMSSETTTTESNEKLSFKQTSYSHQNQSIIQPRVELQLPETYIYRTHNIISKLQEIKKQNALLHLELNEMKEKTNEDDAADESQEKDNTSTLFMRLHDSNTTLNSLKMKLKVEKDVRNALIDKVQSMQEFINNLNNFKNQEIEEIQARHKLELFNIKSSIKHETRQMFENKLEDQKNQYEIKIKELRDINISKDEIIAEKDKIIQQKETEIVRLSEQNKFGKEHLQSILNKLLDRPNEEQDDQFRIQNHILQNRIIKLEKAKMKCVRAYESKLALLQREKHLVECSFQIQLVRQRAQIINEVAGDSQDETKKAVDKLEAKYQTIVANMQATAIQRRLEDQMAVSSILQAASGICDSYGFFTQFFPKNPLERRNKNLRSAGQMPVSVFEGNKVFRNDVTENFGDERRYGELGTLFEKVHVPQRDNGDKARK